MKITGTFDIECASWSKFAVATSYRPGRGIVIHRTIGHLLDSMLAVQKSTWWAHCGGAFDFLAIAEEMRTRGIACSMDLAGARVSRLVGGGIVLRDSFPLVPLSLDVAAELAGAAPPVLGLPCRCGESCGGYCSIRPGDRRKVVSDYCAADARILFDVLHSIRDIGSELGLSMKGTLGGTAWATARDTLKLESADFPPVVAKRIRSAYYGGRVAIVRPVATGPGSHWDLSSAYPHALASTSVPCGEWTPYSGDDASACFENERPGVYACDVVVPDMFFPPLPVRAGGRIAFPTGSFRGCWTRPELVAAIGRGVRVERFVWACVWEREENLFADLVGRWWTARARAGKGSALGKWLRLLPNSIGGKLAEGSERWSARMFPDEVKLCECRGTCRGCGAYEQMDLWGDLWAVPIYRPSTSGHVQWASYMTSATRERWLSTAEEHGKDVVYGDTDSLWTTSDKRPLPSGGGFGDWEFKHEWSDFECAGPRVYRYRNTAYPDTPVVKAAGAKLTAQQWDRGGVHEMRGVMPLAEAASTGRGLFVARPVSWSVPTKGRETGWYGDRLLDSDESVTFPVSHGRLQSKAKPKGDPNSAAHQSKHGIGR